jgi:hypothetical protein
MLLLKLTLAPLLAAAATLVARRWGPRVGGLFVGLPLTTGPIVLFPAIDQGLDFAARATLGILSGLVGLAAFALAYAAASRGAGWAASLALAAVAFFVASAGMGLLGGGVTHAQLGSEAAVAMLRGSVLSWIASRAASSPSGSRWRRRGSRWPSSSACPPRWPPRS